MQSRARNRSFGQKTNDAFPLAESFAQKLNALGNALGGRGLSFELNRYVSVVTDFAKNLGNAGVVEVEGVPFPSAEVGLGLHEGSKGSDFLELVVRFLHEVAGVHENAQPRGLDGVGDAQQAFGRAGQSPVVLEGEVNPALLGLGQALLDRIDAPLESFVHGMPGQNRFLSPQFHEVIEVTGRAPASGVQTDGGDAHLVSEPDAFLGVLDIFFAGCGIGRDEVLMNR